MSAMEPAYLVGRIRDALAREEAELGIGVEVVGGAVALTGVVPSEERRERAGRAAEPLCGGYALVNEITVRPPASPGAAETLR
jgi:osmotically-inducible protein OsmY